MDNSKEIPLSLSYFVSELADTTRQIIETQERIDRIILRLMAYGKTT